ncbi:MAG: MFS transporter, partial [Alphaproteobacteria bacterium]|nr:MFS transporter [Alphaproteobacteria bacterium]
MSVDSAVEEKKSSPLLIWAIMVTFFIYQFIARSAFPTVLTEEYMRYFCLDAEGVGALVSCYYVAYTFVQIPVGIIIDRFSLKIVAPIAVLICACGVWLFMSTQNVRIASIGQTLVGLGSAFSFLMVLKTCIDWFPPEKRAVMLTYASSVGCMGPVIFGPLVATIVKNFDWRHVMMVYTAIGFVLAGTMWLMLEDKKNKDNEVKSENKMSVWQSLKVVVSSPQAWILALFGLMQYSPLSALADLWGTSYIKKLYDADVTVSSFANNMIYIGMVIGGPIF